MSQTVLFFIALISLSSWTTAYADPDDWPAQWTKAREAFDAGQHSKARKLFQDHALPNASTYYNIAVTYFAQEKFGLSTAFFEKAARLQPHDLDIQHNLELSQKKLIHEIGKQNLDPASAYWETLANRYTLDEALGVVGLVSVFCIFIWVRPYLRTRSFRSTFLTPSSAMGIILLLISLGLYSLQIFAQRNPPAIFLTSQPIYSGPGQHYLELDQLDAGVKVRLTGSNVKDQAGDIWHQIRFTPEQSVGWIPQESILILTGRS